MMSAGPIVKFTEGWAVSIAAFGKAHYYLRDKASFARPICGGRVWRTGALRGLGSWEKCKRCTAMRHGRAE